MKEISEKELFELLKTEITTCFFEANSASSQDISEWKGQDIVTFQEDLFDKTKATVSEKWFYTYFKSDFEKLPRIDMLNILAEYAGYNNWHEFTNKHNQKKTDESTEIKSDEVEKEVIDAEKTNKKPDEITEELNVEKIEKIVNRRFKLLPVIFVSLIITALIATSIYFIFIYQKTYTFCFFDSDRNTPITEPIEIIIDREGFTPWSKFIENGCLEFRSKEDTLLMIIKSTYYKQDTFKINLNLYQGAETIRLEPDDYKVMLRHYSKSSQSVKERIKMLDEMIANDALIYQVYDNEYFGVEVLNKKQYINLVSLPTTSLKNYTLIEAERKDGKIIKIKFKIQSDEG